MFVFSSKLHLKIKGCSKKVEPWSFWECYEKKEKKKETFKFSLTSSKTP